MFHAHAPHRALHSFPTRRSSDLVSLPGDRSFDTYLGALGSFMTPPLRDDTQLHWQHALLDVQLDYTIRSQDSEFSLRRSEEHTSELQSQSNLVCRLLLEKKK